MPSNRQGNGSFFDYGNFANVNLFTNATGTPTFADKVLTTKQSQATPVENFGVKDPGSWDDAPKNAPTSPGAGAGTGQEGGDNNPGPNPTSTQVAINTSTAVLNQLIPTQPNQLDQYASYTYSISWYLLSPQQYNEMTTVQKPNVSGWQLLMQSGGAPAKGRSPAFPLDYYMDDLEIESLIPMGGTNMANSATNIRFKVTEPNGITLIQNIFKAVTSVYKNAQQSQTNTTNNGTLVAKSPTTNATPNYLQAQYCLVIEFYGYDVDGKLVAPATGSFNTSVAGYGQPAVIVKYYPFRLIDIKFQIANRAIEYTITAKPIPQALGSTTDRGTVPFPFTMTGQTVEQLLNGSPTASGSNFVNATDPGARKNTPAPPYVSTLPINEQAAIAAGTDPNAVNDQGMAFGGGGL